MGSDRSLMYIFFHRPSARLDGNFHVDKDMQKISKELLVFVDIPVDKMPTAKVKNLCKRCRVKKLPCAVIADRYGNLLLMGASTKKPDILRKQATKAKAIFEKLDTDLNAKYQKAREMCKARNYQKATEELTQSGYQVNPFHVDVSVQPDVIEAIAAAEKIAPIEVLVNNAGICLVTPFLNITKQEWHKTLDINLTGAFYVAQSVCRHMAKRKRGVVLNMSSKNGLDAEFGHTHYNASKAGLLLLTKTIAIEVLVPC